MSKQFEELKAAALGANLHGWTGIEDSLNADGYSRAMTRFIQHCRPSEILELLAALEEKDQRIAELEQRLQQPIVEHFLAGYDDGHSRGLTMGKLYKGDDQTILHRRACANAYIETLNGEGE